jgi:hypothetical protein
MGIKISDSQARAVIALAEGRCRKRIDNKNPQPAPPAPEPVPVPEPPKVYACPFCRFTTTDKAAWDEHWAAECQPPAPIPPPQTPPAPTPTEPPAPSLPEPDPYDYYYKELVRVPWDKVMPGDQLFWAAGSFDVWITPAINRFIIPSRFRTEPVIVTQQMIEEAR